MLSPLKRGQLEQLTGRSPSSFFYACSSVFGQVNDEKSVCCGVVKSSALFLKNPFADISLIFCPR